MGLRKFARWLREKLSKLRNIIRKKPEVEEERIEVSIEPQPVELPSEERLEERRLQRKEIRASATYVNVDVNISFDTEDSRGRQYRIDFTVEEAIIPADFDDHELNCLIEAAKEALIDEYPELEPLVESIDPADVNVEVRTVYYAHIDHDRKAITNLIIVETRGKYRRSVHRRSYSTPFEYRHCF